MSLSHLSRPSQLSLTIIDTGWLIEGDPAQVWRWSCEPPSPLKVADAHRPGAPQGASP